MIDPKAFASDLAKYRAALARGGTAEITERLALARTVEVLIDTRAGMATILRGAIEAHEAADFYRAELILRDALKLVETGAA